MFDPTRSIFTDRVNERVGVAEEEESEKDEKNAMKTMGHMGNSMHQETN